MTANEVPADPPPPLLMLLMLVMEGWKKQALERGAEHFQHRGPAEEGDTEPGLGDEDEDNDAEDEAGNIFGVFRLCWRPRDGGKEGSEKVSR